MSGGAPHARSVTSPPAAPQSSSSSIVVTGEPNALGTVSIPSTPALPRGGQSPLSELWEAVPIIPCEKPLLSPTVPCATLDLFPKVEGAFLVRQQSEPSDCRLLDCGGHGDCCFNAIGCGLVLMGLIPSVEAEPLTDLRRHSRHYGEVVRSAIVSHGRLASTLAAIVAASGEGGGEQIPFAQAIVSSLASWPQLLQTFRQLNLTSASVDSWLYAMSLPSNDHLPGTYGDSAALLLAADKYQGRIVCHLIDSNGSELAGSPQLFLPRKGLSPKFELTLVCQAEVHFVLRARVVEADAPRPPSAAHMWAKACERVRELELQFRLQQEALLNERLASELLASPELLAQCDLPKSTEPEAELGLTNSPPDAPSADEPPIDPREQAQILQALQASLNAREDAEVAELAMIATHETPSVRSPPPSPPTTAKRVRFDSRETGFSGACFGGGDDHGNLSSVELPLATLRLSQPDDALKVAKARSGGWSEEQRELASFTWPLTTIAEVRRLLDCRLIAPTDLVGFEFSGAVRSALQASGRRALSVDWRLCEIGGMHACLDVRDVLALKRWSRVFLFPPCFQQLRADADCLESKIADGRAFWGCALVLFCFCIAADLLVVEQPDTIVADFVPERYTEFRTSSFQDSPDKFVRLLVRNGALVVPFEPDPAARKRPPHYLHFANSEERDRAKSTWAPFTNLCRALARMLPVLEEAPAPPPYAVAIEHFAMAWHLAGNPVPRGYSDPSARPPKGHRRYQRVRGPGDGRLVEAVTPSLVRPSQRPPIRGGTSERGLLQSYWHDVRAATEQMALVVFVSVLLQPLVYAHVNGFTVHAALLPENTARPSYVQAGQALVTAAVGAGQAAFLVGEYIGGARVVVAPLDYRPQRDQICSTNARRASLLAAGATFVWCTLLALAGTPIGDAAARSVLACQSFVKPGSLLADFVPEGSPERLTFRCGAAPATSVLARPSLLSLSSPPAWKAIAQSMRDNEALISALNSASEDSLLSGWADRVTPLDPSDIPDAFLEALPTFEEGGLERQRFTPVYKPLVTSWVPLPPRQPPVLPDTPACVGSPFDMMLPDTRKLVTSWLRHTLGDLVRVRTAVAEGRAAELVDGTLRRDRPRPIAIGREELFEWARDRVWDCRQQCCQLLDFQAPIDTHLNLGFLRRRLRSYPDQYLVSNILEGARLDADVELQSVFVPHLVSLPLGYASVGKEIRRLRALDWYAFFPNFPFWPLYLNGQGSVARKLEPDRFRRTTEGGGPRQPTYDLSGLMALSINAASFIPHVPAHYRRDQRPEMVEWLTARGLLPEPKQAEGPQAASSKWPKETKPRLAQLLRDLAILKRAASMLGEPLYVFGDDFKDYFNQLAMAECELHKLGIVFLSEGDVLDGNTVSAHVPQVAGDQLVFISERRLGFGTHGASNIAQRFSDAILHLFREDMDRVEVPFFDQPSAGLEAWMTERRFAARADLAAECKDGACPTRTSSEESEEIEARWLVQRRLYSCYVYTDDPIFLVVGVSRTLRALRVWRQLTLDANLIMAIAEKRNLGTHAAWLGVLLLTSLGLLVVPKAKLLRASGTITDVLKGGQPFHIYRSLIGLLEHLRDVNLRGRNVMHGLYAPHGAEGASRYGPNGRVFCDELMTKQLFRWHSLLRESAGVSARAAFLRNEVEPLGSFEAYACSDACLGDEDPAGMGGYCHGLCWQFTVPKSDYDHVTTPLLEFLAVVFNVLSLADYVYPLLGGNGTLLLRTDALTTALVLPNESQRSPSLVDAYQLLAETPAWSRLSPRLRIQHIYGDANALSDPLSRSRWKEFNQRCRQLGVKPIRVALPPCALQLYEQVVQLQRARDIRAHCPVLIVPAGGEEGLAEESAALAQCRGGGSEGAPFLHRLRPRGTPSPPDGRRPSVAASVRSPPAERASSSQSFLQRLGAKEPSTPGVQPMSSPRSAAGIAIPGAAPVGVALRQRLSSSRLAAAASHYASARAMSLAAGPDPTMNLRADISDICRLGDALNEFSEFGANVNTLKKDDRAWEFWELICDNLGTSPMRTSQEVRDNPERQAFLLAVLMMHASAVCKPRTAGRCCIKPRSALAYPLAIIRIFGRWGIAMPGFKSLQAQLAGLQRAYIAYHGAKSLAPRRAEPMRFSMVRDINAIPVDGTRVIRGRRWTDATHDVFMFRRLNVIMIRGGWRLAEWVYHNSGETMYITRDDLWWRINGRMVTDPEPEDLYKLRVGDCAFLAPPRAKPDQMGEIHCPFPVTLPFDGSADNAAAALRDIELRFPCRGPERKVRPVIATESGNPYTHAVLDGLLYEVLRFLYGAAMASLFSWHSYRSGLCCALFAAGCPDAENQLICRWMCPESLHVYRRMGTAKHADWVAKAAAANVDSIQSENAPRVSNDEGYAELFRQMQSASATFMRDWASASGAVAPGATAPVAVAPPRALSAPARVSPAAAPLLAALTRSNAVGRAVLVPKDLYPGETCNERGGSGWEGLVTSATAVTAVVRFVHARTPDGRRYANERLPLSRLQPLS